MNVQELIDLLQQIEDKSQEVYIVSDDHYAGPVYETFTREDIIYIHG
ncbi:hypothetical protein NXY11_01970 [Parabacteroides faecis]|nr:hypothetical protein [Parabacteroides faecis]MCS2894367.1 hypothetical protein [Parabacteroides faecis]UVQ47045.1 hypothetical protein NXY11_01970 [Parabacteroides faecis]